MQSKFYLGDVGNGAAMKLVVNMIMGRFFFLNFVPAILLPLFLVLMVKVTQFLSIFSNGPSIV